MTALRSDDDGGRRAARAVYAYAALRVAAGAFGSCWPFVLNALNGMDQDQPSVAAAREAMFRIERMLSDIGDELRRLQG